MYGYIYKITNKANDKIYVGQHKSDHFDERYFGGGVIIASAVNKYGKENFDREILEGCATKEELDTREIHWIQKLNARDQETGHNISEGGEHGLAGCVKIIRGDDSMIIPKESLGIFLKEGGEGSKSDRQLHIRQIKASSRNISDLNPISKSNYILYLLSKKK